MSLARRTLLASLATLAAVGRAVAGTTPGFVAYDRAAFEQARREGRTVLVHVHADWCPTCRAQQPTLAKLAAAQPLQGVLKVLVDFDTETEFRKTFNVTKQSTVLLFKGEREALRSIALTDPAALEQAILGALTA